MTEQQQAAMRQALEALEKIGLRGWVERKEDAITAIREALAEQPAQQQEPGAFPPVQFEKVAEGVEVGYDMLGGVDIRLGGEFVYVHINYDYRYTHNAARKALADQIVGLLTSPPASKPLPEHYTVLEQTLTRLQKRYADLEGKVGKPWVGLTPERRSEIESNVLMNGGNYPEVLEAIENELREKNTGEAK